MIEIEIELAFVTFLERLAAPLERNFRAVDGGREARLDIDIRVIGKAGNERYPEIDITDRMHHTLRFVVKNDARIEHLDVVQRETWRSGIRLVLGLEPFVEQIGDVVTSVIEPRYRDTGALQADIVDHRGILEQRGRRQIDEQLVEARHFLAIPGLDRNPGDLGRKGEGIDRDVVNADLAMQLFAELREQHRFQ